MKPALIMKATRSLKIELTIALTAVLFLLAMPMIAVMTLTHADSISKANSVYDVTSYPGDDYAWGNCTWWAAIRRSQIGAPIPNSWGNAATWAVRAQADGYLVDHTPSYGAIMQTPYVDNGLGHVAFVENVNPVDGSWTISEMNVEGLDVVDYKTLPAVDAAGYSFIHTQSSEVPNM
jgi:surface antigen